ncbi:hypothetical protein, partial [Burkholderia sp. Leaf177]|uniref:hypothetical protein n=1 Tax=Burkholderia sp. Leaf177 TaxID=1736287 RepID=UPI001F48426E
SAPPLLAVGRKGKLINIEIILWSHGERKLVAVHECDVCKNVISISSRMGPACSVVSFVAATQIAPYENHLRRLLDVIVFLRLVDSADSGQFMFEVTKRRVKAKACSFY